MKKRVVITLLALAVAAPLLGTASCGDNTGIGADGSADSTLDNNLLPDGGGGDSPFTTDGPNPTDGGGGDTGCWSNCSTDGGPVNCLNLASSCKSNSECCSLNCLNGSCQPPQCTADNASCTSNAQCCSGTCANGTCTPLNTTCKTLGNPCTAGSQCCSTYCTNGVCAQPSYCGQVGDICSKPADCCGGICTIQQGQNFGTCGQPSQTGAQCSAIDGVVCSTTDAGVTDGGLPACGGDCCSRDCAPWGPTQVFICQPASGCHPVGDICYKNSECCGGTGTNPTEVCNQPDAGLAGVCSNPTGCKPNGDICRLQSNQCNATDNCCSGNVQQFDTCKQDNLGVPRCSYAGDAGCQPSNGTCATSADCCNLNPCVPDQDGGLTCYPSSCVPTAGQCTTDADCCVGGHCYIPGGQTTGTCQPLTTPDGGTTTDSGTTDSGTTDASTPPPCALYGQVCSTSGDCCNGVPCTNGRCVYPVY
ncbi:MAG TPA: hypothetical protein VLM85_12830 [Polyangiaceae bacterium]|nr:hypothetical protein [Polyangiaceae bacterium]